MSVSRCCWQSVAWRIAQWQAGRKGPTAATFLTPPESAKPWVYWFWLNGNITREGITADLEAMHRVGIGGVLIMEVDQGVPLGPVPFAGPKWRELFKHMVAEAGRLGIEVDMNNDAGWNGSGGPWVKPEHAMQKVVWTRDRRRGAAASSTDTLPQPQAVGGYYRDIAVLAFPTPAADADPKTRVRIDHIEGKIGRGPRDGDAEGAVSRRAAPTPSSPATASSISPPSSTTKGRLTWDVPAGKWTVLRIGHTLTGVVNAPSPEVGRGPGMRQAQPRGDRRAFGRPDGQADRRRRPRGRQDAHLHAHRQLGKRLAELDAQDARGVPEAPRLRPLAVAARR